MIKTATNRPIREIRFLFPRNQDFSSQNVIDRIIECRDNERRINDSPMLFHVGRFLFLSFFFFFFFLLFKHRILIYRIKRRGKFVSYELDPVRTSRCRFIGLSQLFRFSTFRS